MAIDHEIMNSDEKHNQQSQATEPPDNELASPADSKQAGSVADGVTPTSDKPPHSTTGVPQSNVESKSELVAEQKPKRKILIGSQLDEGESNVGHSETTESGVKRPIVDVELKPANINQAVNDHKSAETGPLRSDAVSAAAESSIAVQYEIPSVENVDAEIESMLEGVSMDELVAQGSISEELELESRVKATVDKIHNEHVFFNLKGRFVGIAALRSFKDPPELGAMLDVVIRSFNQEDGFYEVSVPGATIEVADWSDLTPGAIVDAKITGSNTGGLECSVNNIRGFIPASQIEIYRVENFGDYVNHKLQCVVTEANPNKKKLVLSHRAIAEREREEQKKTTLASLQPGQILDGTVIKLMDFGAFVDIGGAEGLIHISKLAWDRVTHPSEIVKEGEKISVKIENVNQQTGKIALSYRDTQEHPWKRVDEKYPVNSTVNGVVSKLAQFGAFVKLEPGIEGLVHISEIAHHRVVSVKTHLNVGDSIDVKILSVDPEAQKIGLSIRALVEKPPEPESKLESEVAEPLRDSVVPKNHKPLQGGIRRRSGGEEFGLKW